MTRKFDSEAFEGFLQPTINDSVNVQADRKTGRLSNVPMVASAPNPIGKPMTLKEKVATFCKEAAKRFEGFAVEALSMCPAPEGRTQALLVYSYEEEAVPVAPTEMPKVATA